MQCNSGICSDCYMLNISCKFHLMLSRFVADQKEKWRFNVQKCLKVLNVNYKQIQNTPSTEKGDMPGISGDYSQGMKKESM